MHLLYIIALPIGNLEDITLRALRLLSEVSLIAAEDTRTIRKLLTRHKIRTPRLVSYTEHSRGSRTSAILAALDQADVALVSEAGTPGISDPGMHLVSEAAAAGHRIVPIPGPSAMTSALAASGLPARRVQFLSFLPRTRGPRRRLLREVSDDPAAIVVFEAPHRLRATLADILAVLGNRRITVCRELTKLYEEIFRGTVSEAIEHFPTPRGEFTLVIEGAPKGKPKQKEPSDIDNQLRQLRENGARAREAVRTVVLRSGASRQEVYRRWLELSDGEHS